MRMFIACLGTESMTFSPFLTTRGDFNELGVYHGRTGEGKKPAWAKVLDLWRKIGEDGGFEVIESLSASATPKGITEGRVYEEFREEILEDLRTNLPVDVVMLNLHGAMVAQGYPDCEGDLISKVREIVGAGVIIGVELDLHCHLTELMVKNASILKACKEYPHSDIANVSFELMNSVLRLQKTKMNPTTAVFDCNLLGLIPTTTKLMKKFVKEMKKKELDESILAVNFCHGFQWGDVTEAGAKVWVTALDNFPLAQKAANYFGTKIYHLRKQIYSRYLTINEFVQDAQRIEKMPKIYADVSDNAGGGATSDSTFLLDTIISYNLKNFAIGMIYDPVMVELAKLHGEGASVDFRIGAKLLKNSGNPINIRAMVKKILLNFNQDYKQSGIPIPMPVGDLVWLQYNGIDILINSIRCQVFTPEPFTAVGIDLKSKTGIVVKSSQHFYKKFKKVSQNISYVATPGILSPIVGELTYQYLDTDKYPFVDDPLNLGEIEQEVN